MRHSRRWLPFGLKSAKRCAEPPPPDRHEYHDEDREEREEREAWRPLPTLEPERDVFVFERDADGNVRIVSIRGGSDRTSPKTRERRWSLLGMKVALIEATLLVGFAAVVVLTTKHHVKELLPQTLAEGWVVYGIAVLATVVAVVIVRCCRR